MSESLPGTMSIFAEALAQQTGSGLTGQAALAALYEAIPTGKVKAADLLPIAAEIMSKRAEPKIGALRKTSMAEQARLGIALQDLVEVFSTSGGEEGFARFFRSMTASMERLTPVVKGLSEAFNWFTKQLELPLILLGDIGGHVDRLAPSFRNLKAGIDSLHPSLGKLLAIGAMLLTPWTRIFAVFGGLFLILEDISVGMMGGLSYTGRFFDFLEKFVEFDRGIMGVAMAFIAVAAAIKLTSAVAKASLLGDLLNPKKTKKPGGPNPPPNSQPSKRWKAVGFGLPLKLLAAYWGMNSDELQERLKVNYSSEEIVNSLLAPFGSTLGVIATELDPVLKKLDPHQRTEYFEGLSKPGKQGMWEDLSGYIEYKSDKDAAWRLDNQHLSDIPDMPTSAEQALAQVAPVNKTSNINNTFEINIEGALDPQGLATMMENQIMPQFEVFFNNQLDVVNQTFGSE